MDFNEIANKFMYCIYEEFGNIYKECKENNITPSETILKRTAEGGYIHDNGFEGIDNGYIPYYNYLKNDTKSQQEEPIMIEDNNYEIPYSFEYEPYLLNDNNYSITFDHEVDTNNSIQMIEEMYNEEPITVEEDVDSDEIIDVLSFLTNKISKVKKHIIHYISNYRPIMNQYTHNIDTVLIE